MVKVGRKGRHVLTGVSRSGVLTGAASRKAAGKKLMGGKAAVGRMRLAAKRRVPFTGVSKTAVTAISKFPFENLCCTIAE